MYISGDYNMSGSDYIILRAIEEFVMFELIIYQLHCTEDKTAGAEVKKRNW